MTQRQKDDWTRMLWPLVALVVIACGFFLGVFALIPREAAEQRTALLGLLGMITTAVVTIGMQRLSTKVERIREQTNGHLSELLRMSDQMQTRGHVSRETNRPEDN